MISFESYLTEYFKCDVSKILSDSEISILKAMDLLTPEEFWIEFGSPPESFLNYLIIKLS